MSHTSLELVFGEQGSQERMDTGLLYSYERVDPVAIVMLSLKCLISGNRPLNCFKIFPLNSF